MSPSSRTTGNDPVEGVDPGGTHPTQPGNKTQAGNTTQPGDKAQPGNKAGGERKVEHHVDSGDRNTRESSKVAPATRDGTSDSGPGVT